MTISKQELANNAILISEFLQLPKNTFRVRDTENQQPLTKQQPLIKMKGIVGYGIKDDLELVHEHGRYTEKSLHIEGYYDKTYYAFFPEEMRFHLSYDWLMLVMSRIFEECFENLDNHLTREDKGEVYRKYQQAQFLIFRNPIIDAYQEVCSLIKFYNKNIEK